MGDQDGAQVRLPQSRVVDDLGERDGVIEGLADEYDVPYAKLEQRLQDPKVIDLIPRDYIEKNLVLPLFCIRNVLTVAVTEPANLFLVEELKCLTGKEVQIVATTHSDILIDALSERPEAVLVCERDENGTTMERLERAKLKEWLEKYSLGELWRRGQIGGKRW